MANTTRGPYRQRLVDPFVDELFAQLPALMVIGPRAVGKTTSAARRAATTVSLEPEAPPHPAGSSRRHLRTRQLRVRVVVRVGAGAKSKPARASGYRAPGKPFGAGQAALR
jgi:hypothetical protein